MVLICQPVFIILFLSFLSRVLPYNITDMNLVRFVPDQNFTELADQITRIILSIGSNYLNTDFIVHLTIPIKPGKMLQILDEISQRVGSNGVIFTNNSYCCETFENLEFVIEKQIFIQYLPDIYIIPVKTLRQSDHFKAQMKAFNDNDFFNQRAIFFLIMLTDQCKFDFSNEAAQCFNYMWKHNRMSVIILVWSTCDFNLVMFTALPFSKQNQCRTVLKEEMTIYNIKEQKVELNNSIYNKDLRDFKKCNFIVATVPMSPYVVENVIKTGNTTHIEYISGIDVEMFRLFSNKYNFTFTFDQSNGYDSNAWFRILPNGTIAGITWDVLCLKTELAFGGLMPSQRNYYHYEYSSCYKYAYLSWYVSDAGFSPHWKIFVGTFSISVWILFSITFVVAGLLYFYMDNFTLENPNSKLICNINKVPILNLFSVALSLSTTLEPKSNYVRILFVALNMFSLHLTIAYSSLLFLLITNPPLEKEILTVEDLSKSGLKVCSSAIYLELFNAISLDNTTRLVLSNSFECPDLRTCITQLVRNRNFTLMEKPDNVENLINTKQSKIHRIEESALGYCSSMMASRGSPLTPGLNKITQISFQSGLVFKWEKDVIQKSTFLKETGKHSEENIPLSYNTMKGCFYILIGGQLISCLVFLAELLLYFFCLKKNK